AAGPRPRLSWKLPAGGTAGCEVEVLIDGRTREIVPVKGHLLIAWPIRPLRSGEQVQWRVRTGVSPWSEWHAFEAGLFDEDWTARWISPIEHQEHPKGHRPAHVLRGSFTARGEVARARLYATALG